MSVTLEEVLREKFATGYNPIAVEVLLNPSDDGLEVVIEGNHYAVADDVIVLLPSDHSHPSADEIAEGDMIAFFEERFGMVSYSKSENDGGEIVYEIKNDQEQTIITGTISQLRDSIQNEQPVEGTLPEEGNTKSPSSEALAVSDSNDGETSATPNVSEPGLAAIAGDTSADEVAEEAPDTQPETDEGNAEVGESADNSSTTEDGGSSEEVVVDADGDGIDDALEERTTIILKAFDSVELKPVSTADNGVTIFAVINHGGDEVIRGTMLNLFEEAIAISEVSEG